MILTFYEMLGRWSTVSRNMTMYAVDMFQLLKMVSCSPAHGATCGRSGGEVQEHSAQLLFHFRKMTVEIDRMK